MKRDGLHERIEHEVAELRDAYPRVTHCHTALAQWREEADQRHALWLDIRWPQHQSIVSGPACANAAQALRAGFDKAREALAATHA
jgi:hypothetical protein